MACCAIPESFPFLSVEALVARRQWEAIDGLVSFSEKQYQISAGLARNCRFFLIERPRPRHKTVVALGRFSDRNIRAPEAVAKAAQTDPDAAVRLIARDMISRGQPHHRGRKAALRDEGRARRTRV
jgi:hypothetical protein